MLFIKITTMDIIMISIIKFLGELGFLSNKVKAKKTIAKPAPVIKKKTKKKSKKK